MMLMMVVEGEAEAVGRNVPYCSYVQSEFCFLTILSKILWKAYLKKPHFRPSAMQKKSNNERYEIVVEHSSHAFPTKRTLAIFTHTHMLPNIMLSDKNILWTYSHKKKRRICVVQKSVFSVKSWKGGGTNRENTKPTQFYFYPILQY